MFVSANMLHKQECLMKIGAKARKTHDEASDLEVHGSPTESLYWRRNGNAAMQFASGKENKIVEYC